MELSNSGAGYLSNLTPLRGIASLLTVLYHIDLMLGAGGNLLVKFKDSLLFTKLYLMVDFFFVLSGFIMFYVYGKWFKDSIRWPAFKQFGIARFARVYPLHFCMLFFLIAERLWYLHTGAADNPFTASSDTGVSVISNLFLVQSMNLHNWFSWNNAAWSISTEWWMYMVFPFLVKPFLHLAGRGRLLVVMTCITGYLLIMFYIQQFVTTPPALSFIFSGKPEATLNVSYQFGFLRCLFGFVLGMITYLAYKDNLAKKFFARGSVFVLLSLCLFTSLHFALWDVVSVNFFPLMILSAAYGSKKMNRFFSRKPLQRIGDWSYSIYLVHQPILYTIFDLFTYFNPPARNAPPPSFSVGFGWTFSLVFVALTLFVASITFRYIELPARMWINKKFAGVHASGHILPTS
jgi:peptidoglycan/LPS O-acetylase OafA/YrhL